MCHQAAWVLLSVLAILFAALAATVRLCLPAQPWVSRHMGSCRSASRSSRASRHRSIPFPIIINHIILDNIATVINSSQLFELSIACFNASFSRSVKGRDEFSMSHLHINLICSSVIVFRLPTNISLSTSLLVKTSVAFTLYLRERVVLKSQHISKDYIYRAIV